MLLLVRLVGGSQGWVERHGAGQTTGRSDCPKKLNPAPSTGTQPHRSWQQVLALFLPPYKSTLFSMTGTFHTESTRRISEESLVTQDQGQGRQQWLRNVDTNGAFTSCNPTPPNKAVTFLTCKTGLYSCRRDHNNAGDRSWSSKPSSLSQAQVLRAACEAHCELSSPLPAPLPQDRPDHCTTYLSSISSLWWRLVNTFSDPRIRKVLVETPWMHSKSTHPKGIVCFWTFEKYSLMAYAIDDRNKYISLSFHSYCKFKRKPPLSRDQSIHAEPDSLPALFLNSNIPKMVATHEISDLQLECASPITWKPC